MEGQQENKLYTVNVLIKIKQKLFWSLNIINDSARKRPEPKNGSQWKECKLERHTNGIILDDVSKSCKIFIFKLNFKN